MNKISAKQMIWLCLATLSITLLPVTVRAAHDQCQDCHAGMGSDSTAGQKVTRTCEQCHEESHGANDHPVNIVMKRMPGPDLPLFNDTMTCTTCHDPHGQLAPMLRLPENELCSSCHEN